MAGLWNKLHSIRSPDAFRVMDHQSILNSRPCSWRGSFCASCGFAASADREPGSVMLVSGKSGEVAAMNDPRDV